ncbi:hypothetical protein MHUMG1_10350 [Metarhizium humberi]|uniref:Hydroxynaphthalene reductase-like protein Arp2 n=1 Tax=Metarhizium humberi TaxID=2596975 RepID=A0A9P8M1K1_9HYPO|nr:hypothetical protein MHUMG1_10350 [Metarhizium humberi]
MSPQYQANALFDVNNLIAVITGAGSGIGRVIAHTLAANGAKAVYVLGRRAEALETTKKTSVNPSVITPIICDVTSKDSLQAAASLVRQDAGYCDVVFANSGVATADASALIPSIGSISIKAIQEGLWQHSMEEFTETFHVNVTGVFYTAVAFLNLLDEGNKRRVVPQTAQIIITTSLGGFARKPTLSFAYGPSKAAAGHLAKQLATVLAPYKIRINTIAPGFFPSEMTQNLPFMNGGGGSSQAANIPLGRMGNEEDIAGAILFLASRAGSYIDGNVLLTDGGRGCVIPSTY